MSPYFVIPLLLFVVVVGGGGGGGRRGRGYWVFAVFKI